jgi:hypothetical protein
VLFAAVAVYVSVPAPWHRVEVAPDAKTGVPTVAATVTVADPVMLFEQVGAL